MLVNQISPPMRFPINTVDILFSTFAPCLIARHYTTSAIQPPVCSLTEPADPAPCGGEGDAGGADGRLGPGAGRGATPAAAAGRPRRPDAAEEGAEAL